MKLTYKQSLFGFAVLLVVILIFAVGCGGGQGQDAAVDFPQGNIDFVVPVNPGGGLDANARTVAPYIEKYLPNPTNITIQNMPGAEFAIGINHVINARSDGYTIGLFFQAFALNQALDRAEYDLTEVTWIGGLTSMPNFLSVAMDSPYQSVEDLIEASKERPLNVSIPGFTSVTGSGAVLHAHLLGIDVNFIPADSAADTLVALLRGDSEFIHSTSPTVISAIEEGQVRVLEVYGSERSSIIPDVPTSLERGRPPELVDIFETIYMIGATPGVPDAVAEILRAAVAQAVADPDYYEEISKTGSLPSYRTAEECKSIIESNLRLFTEYADIMNQYIK